MAKEKRTSSIDMTSGSPYRLIISFTLPMLLGNIFQQLYNMVDSIVVGNVIGDQALAAVGYRLPDYLHAQLAVYGHRHRRHRHDLAVSTVRAIWKRWTTPSTPSIWRCWSALCR